MLGSAALMALQDEWASLAPLESFDPLAFAPDSQASEQLCQFVLALALIYNDVKDIIGAVVTLRDSKPKGKWAINRSWGSYAGIEFHFIRAFISLLHEMFDLIRNNEDLLKDALLNEIVRNLNQSGKQNWNELVRVSLDATPKTELGKILLLVRNKLSSHYDLKCLAKGYKYQFLADEKV